MKVYTYT